MRYRSAEERESAFSALASRFQAGEFTETVYRASLFALGERGDELDRIVRHQSEIRNEKSPRLSRGRT